MADLLLQEKLQPSLLDRLTDDDPELKQESRQKRVMTVSKLRELMLRDLNWLFNTSSPQHLRNQVEYPYVSRSVLSYGKRDMTGMHIRGDDLGAIQAAVRQTILDFEPRILAKTLKVRAKIEDGEQNNAVLKFEIEGSLWCQPVPLQLFLRTAIDLENGDVRISDFSC
jgi:type VI secretion system protein ImpF